jgi:hypothetical protein
MAATSRASGVKRFFFLSARHSAAGLCSRVTDECNHEAENKKKKKKKKKGKEKEKRKEPRRQNLHYCPGDRLGNLGIHRSQSDFKIKRRGSERRGTGGGGRGGRPGAASELASCRFGSAA